MQNLVISALQTKHFTKKHQLLLWLLPQAQEQIILRGGALRHIRRARNKGLPKSYDRIASKRAKNENPKELNGNQTNLPWSVDLMVVIIHNIVTVSPLKLMNWKWFQHNECQFKVLVTARTRRWMSKLYSVPSLHFWKDLFDSVYKPYMHMHL